MHILPYSCAVLVVLGSLRPTTGRKPLSAAHLAAPMLVVRPSRSAGRATASDALALRKRCHHPNPHAVSIRFYDQLRQRRSHSPGVDLFIIYVHSDRRRTLEPFDQIPQRQGCRTSSEQIAAWPEHAVISRASSCSIGSTWASTLNSRQHRTGIGKRQIAYRTLARLVGCAPDALRSMPDDRSTPAATFCVLPPA